MTNKNTSFDNWLLECKRLMYEGNWHYQAIKEINEKHIIEESKEHFNDGKTCQEYIDEIHDLWLDQQ